MQRRSVPRLALDALNHAMGLARSEAAVARAELSEKASQAVTGAALLAVAAVLLIPVAVILLMAFAAWLAELGLRPSLAFVCAGLAGFVVVGGLALVGKSKVSPASLSPRRMTRGLARDMDAAKRVM